MLSCATKVLATAPAGRILNSIATHWRGLRLHGFFAIPKYFYELRSSSDIQLCRFVLLCPVATTARLWPGAQPRTPQAQDTVSLYSSRVLHPTSLARGPIVSNRSKV